ncbi:MAG TPA: MarR family transcriptional regulator [Vicinamibacterales bacterium]|nr:MarR family transcriptional regulator [Vicinamibacterales bacterium]
MVRRSVRRTALERDTYLALVRAVGEFEREAAELLRKFDLSAAQYNVLRILRGAGPGGATCGEVGGQLLRHDPDVTRLLDRLEAAGLISRSRDTADRRVVRTRITDAALALLDRLDAPVTELHTRQFGHVPDATLASLRGLVEQVRARTGS